MKKFCEFSALFAILLGLCLPLQADDGNVEFDQGVDTRLILQEAMDRADRESIGVKSADFTTHAVKKTCKVSFQSIRLELTADRRYGRAEYRIGENCTPTLESVTYSTEAPKEALGSLRKTNGLGERAEMQVSRPGKESISPKNLYSCTMNVYEKDVVGVVMITLRNGTSWNTDTSGNVLDGTVHGLIFRNLDWWWVDGKPAVNIGFSGPTAGYSQVRGGFFCQGAGPVSNYVCGDQPAYRITLEGDMSFYGDSSCAGVENYTGETVPLGRVTFEIFRGG